MSGPVTRSAAPAARPSPPSSASASWGLLEILIGFYEFLAYRANWWKYEPARVIVGSVCALYIPLGEFFMFLTVVPLAARAIAGERRRMASALENGRLFALAIVLGYAAGSVLLEVP